MFDDSGDMKVAKTKAVLKNTLKVEMERRHAEVDASFLDESAVLWVVPLPTCGTVQFPYNVRRHIQNHLDSSDVYLLFDRYKEGSLKQSTRNYRDKAASRVYSLRPTAKLPSQKVVLTVSSNTKQLIDLILTELIPQGHVEW